VEKIVDILWKRLAESMNNAEERDVSIVEIETRDSSLIVENSSKRM
jgi:hypothetical protein